MCAYRHTQTCLCIHTHVHGELRAAAEIRVSWVGGWVTCEPPQSLWDWGLKVLSAFVATSPLA